MGIISDSEVFDTHEKVHNFLSCYKYDKIVDIIFNNVIFNKSGIEGDIYRSLLRINERGFTDKIDKSERKTLTINRITKDIVHVLINDSSYLKYIPKEYDYLIWHLSSLMKSKIKGLTSLEDISKIMFKELSKVKVEIYISESMLSDLFLEFHEAELNILFSRNYNNMTFKSLGDKYGISVSRISQIYLKTLSRIHKKIASLRESNKEWKNLIK